MSDDPALKAPIQDITSTDTDTEGTTQENPSPQVFDITPDLNISPAKDEPENNEIISKDKPINELPDMVPQLSTEKTEQIKPEEKPITPATVFGPANPPTKTVGMGTKSYTMDSAEKPTKNELPQTLQEKISTIQAPTTTKKISDKPWEAQPGSKIKPLKTYESDIAEAMNRKKISTSSAVIAEKKREEQAGVKTNEKTSDQSGLPLGTNIQDLQNENKKNPYKNSHSTRNWFLIIISLILVSGGVFAGYRLYLKSPVAPTPLPTNTNPIDIRKSLISSDSKVTINIDNQNRNGILSKIKSENDFASNSGSIKEIILTRATDGVAKSISANEMLGYAQIVAPDLFSRSLGPDWMLGIYKGSDEKNYPFVITTNNFFQNTFAGMIQWEKTFVNDFKDFLYYVPENEENSTTTISDFTLRGEYKDKIIKNRDVREYVAENGHIIFLYSFISNDKLIVTNNEEALTEIITRLEKSSSIR